MYNRTSCRGIICILRGVFSYDLAVFSSKVIRYYDFITLIKGLSMSGKKINLIMYIKKSVRLTFVILGIFFVYGMALMILAPGS
jgi:hypothetical protein